MRRQNNEFKPEASMLKHIFRKPFRSFLFASILFFSLSFTVNGASNNRNLIINGAQLDAHNHIASPELIELTTSSISQEELQKKFPNGIQTNAAGVVRQMDDANIRKAVVTSLAHFSLLDDEGMKRENDWAAAQFAKFPDRIIGFCGINPLRKTAVAEIDRCIDELGMKGVKLHVIASNLDLSNKKVLFRIRKVFHKLNKRAVPVLFHVTEVTDCGLREHLLMNIGEIFARFPDVKLMLAHGFGNCNLDPLVNLVYALPFFFPKPENIFTETSSMFNFYKDAPIEKKREIVWLLRKFGINRVFYGSDYIALQPENPRPVETLQNLAAYPFTQDEIDTILNNKGTHWLTPIK